jgi:short-subunit dehydrogenase
MSFKQKIVYVTGASSGLGAEFARQLVSAGARLALFARRQTELDALVRECERLSGAEGGSATAFVLDVTDRAAVQAAFAKAEAALGPADVLIANAGVGYPVRVTKFDAGRAADIYRVNVFGALNAIECVLPAMLRRRSGHIVGISSIAAYKSFPESHVYCASKAALSAQLEGLRLELMPHGVDVTTICPGFIKTAMTERNTIPMPFITTEVIAVRRMLGAIARRARVYVFPKRMFLLMLLLRLVPGRVIARTMARKGYKLDAPG